jgi:hypothetical protein
MRKYNFVYTARTAQPSDQCGVYVATDKVGEDTPLYLQRA